MKGRVLKLLLVFFFMINFINVKSQNLDSIDIFRISSNIKLFIYFPPSNEDELLKLSEVIKYQLKDKKELEKIASELSSLKPTREIGHYLYLVATIYQDDISEKVYIFKNNVIHYREEAFSISNRSSLLHLLSDKDMETDSTSWKW